MKPTEFLSALEKFRSKNVFNPYAERCPVYDVNDAPSRRRKALLRLLESATSMEIDALWIGRDLGHRGGRRTGLALTDDVHLTVHATRWKVSVERATTGAVVAERTAAVIWSMLARVSAPVFLWNVFPFHPHEPGQPFTNRAHSSRERAIGEALLAELIIMLRPRRLVAVGNNAAKVARRFEGLAEVVQVRHPSYGGQRDFIEQIEDIYCLQSSTGQQHFADRLFE
jgi:hypothetical protein